MIGTLTVNPIPIILRSGSANKVYDGLPLSYDNWTKILGEIIPTHELKVDIEGEITDVGVINNLIFAYVFDEDDNDVTRYYEFTYHLGELTILPSLYGGSDIADEPFDQLDNLELQILSTQNEMIYLRDKSWGDYNMRSWKTGIQHNLALSLNPLSFVSYALSHAGFNSNPLQVKYIRDQIPYLIPYYLTDTLSGLNDVQVFKKPNETESYNSISFDYMKNKEALSPVSSLTMDELLYKTHVYNTYLELPESTQTEMIQLALENNLDKK